MNEVHLSIQINATIQVAHLDQINAYFAGMEKLLKALHEPSAMSHELRAILQQKDEPSNGNGHEPGKEVTSGYSHQGCHSE